MKSWNKPGKSWVAVAAALLLSASASQSWAAAQNNKPEGKCHSTLAKNVGKHEAAVAKALAECKNKFAGSCPDTEAQAAIDKSAEKVAAGATKSCQSVCNVSEVGCISSATCPPNGASPETCTAGSGLQFEISEMSFPGPYCDALSKTGKMRDPEDFGRCATGLGENIANEIIENVYGSLASAPSDASQDCLDTIMKALPKTASKMAGTLSKCRVKQLTSAAPEVVPSSCETGDPKTADSLNKARAKFADKITDVCSPTALAGLDICGAGIGGVAATADAVTCLTQVLNEVSVSSANERTYAPISVTNAAYPQTAAARCGDNIINQLPNQFALNGEECDGTELGSCASCLPPGDVFECTCAETKRSRVFADGFAADLDNGWTGASQNARTPDGAGFVAEVSNCDCSAFTGASCTGTSGDPVCDVTAEVAPRCSHRIGDHTTCDQVGNNNGIHTDGDCKACSEEALNGGDFCTGAARYCLGGSSDGAACNEATDCPGGGTCTATGRCSVGSFIGNGCVGAQQCGICDAGTNLGQACGSDGNCGIGGHCATQPSSSCSAKSCLGGANDSDPCNTNGDCTGGRCASTSDCFSRCYDADDNDHGPCWAQSDCTTPGDRCRGACDSTNYCLKIGNGAPLPLSSEGTSVCLLNYFFTNVTGTRNIVTGSHALDYELRSLIHYGGNNMINSVPCPVCGGFCEVNSPPKFTDRFRCGGSCSGPEKECRYGVNIGQSCSTNADCDDQLCGAVTCRFDDDCPSGATCDGTASPDCSGKNCDLGSVCSVGPNEGLRCRIEAYTAFGTTSIDCPPYPVNNVSGSGLAISWTPLTSGTVSLESPATCDAVGFQNFSCNCVLGGSSTKTAPNKCEAACDDPNPAFFGKPCSAYTTCEGGAEASAKCDEDSDCSGGGTCSGTPMGECPAGRCVPLCVERGTCTGGTRDGKFCALDEDCTGGGTCDNPDPEEGACAQGTFNHCDGPGWGFVSCSPSQLDTQMGCEWGTDTMPNGPNAQPGAGYCRSDINNCFVNDGTATGGGDATNSISVATFCIPPSTNSAVNSTTGLPGPGRIRQPSTVVINFDSLP